MFIHLFINMLFAEAGVPRSDAFLLSESRSRLRTEGEIMKKTKIESTHIVKDDLYTNVFYKV